MPINLLQADHVPVKFVIVGAIAADHLKELLLEERLAMLPGEMLGRHSWERIDQILGKHVPVEDTDSHRLWVRSNMRPIPSKQFIVSFHHFFYLL